jgi:hypothetical protein
MYEIEEAIQKIYYLAQIVRKHINTHRYQSILINESGYWDQICSSLDVIDDTLLTIESYINNDFPNDTGVMYLFIYGILQTLFLQQDALNHLSESFDVDYQLGDKLKKIREVRNAAIGHPTKLNRKGDIYHYHLSRRSMNKNGFKLLQYSETESVKFIDVETISSIKEQLNEVIIKYSSIVEKLNTVDKDHKEKFRENSLQDKFHSGLGYNFQKIASGIESHSNRDKEWGYKNLVIVREVFEEFKQGLITRNELNDFIEYDLNEYFHALNKLDEYFNGKSEWMEKLDANIYHEYIYKKSEYFISIAKEIDASYLE